MIIDTHVAGIPCRASLTRYSPGAPMRVTGWGFGDAEPPEPEEVEFVVLDRGGRAAPWLERKMGDDDYQRICGELIAAREDA